MPLRNLPGGIDSGGITVQKLEAMKTLLVATKRNLQLVDASLEMLENGRVPLELPSDIQTEHMAALFGATDDLDAAPGIEIGVGSNPNNYGFGNPKTGTIRVREEAAFVCTGILVAIAIHGNDINLEPASDAQIEFFEDVNNTVVLGNDDDCSFVPYLRLRDGNTGRDLITGLTEAPLDRGRGAIPFSYLTSIRPGLGSNQKNKLFSEFTIPRGGTVKAEVFNLGIFDNNSDTFKRAYVSLLGYQVYGG